MNTNIRTADALASVLLTGQQPSRIQRKGRYTSESMAHPPKMLPAIAAQVIATYTEPGDLVIDPMCGLAELLHQTGELAHAVVRACPDDKADLYVKLGLRMTYYPQKQLVEARVTPASTCAKGLCPRGDLNPHAP